MFYLKDHSCRLIPKIIVKKKSYNVTFKMETVLKNTYTCLDQKSKLFKTNSIAIEQKNFPKKNLHQKASFFYKMAFWKVVKWYGN